MKPKTQLIKDTTKYERLICSLVDSLASFS